VVREHGEELRLARNPGSHAINFNAYKAWMALEAFGRGEDVLVYRDANSFKYPHLLEGWDRMEEVSRRLLDVCPFWMFAERPGCTVEHHVKPAFIDEYITDEGARRAVRGRPLLNASFFICRRCPLAQQILEEVLRLHLQRVDLCWPDRAPIWAFGTRCRYGSATSSGHLATSSCGRAAIRTPSTSC
jgi:hypothetical protein